MSPRDDSLCALREGVWPPTCGFINVSVCDGHRPGGENHKGVIDFWRRPKQAYAVVQEKYLAASAAAAAAAAAARDWRRREHGPRRQ